MKRNLHLGFEVGDFSVDPLAGHLTGPTGTRHLQPKVMDVFVCLAEHARELVEREDILNRVWGRHATSEEVLTRCISELRSALGDDRGNPQYIKTVPKRGYRLLKPIADAPAAPEALDQPSAVRERIPAAAPDPPSPAAALASVAVLPFEDYSRDESGARLAHAFTSELQTSLARIDRLRVASRRSSFAIASKTLDITEVGKELNVHYVISGNLRCDDNELRVQVELDDCETGMQVWAQSYDRKSTDILSLEREIADSIVASFATQKQIAEMAWAKRSPTSSLDAWGLVQKSRSMALEYTVEGLKKATDPLMRAIELDPDYAAAHATLGSLLVEALINGLSDDPERDEATAYKSAVTAVALAPRDPFILKMVALVWLYCGDCRRSITSLRKAVQLAPFDFGAWGYMGWPLTASGSAEDLAELHHILDRLLGMNPDHPGVPFWLYHRSVAYTCEGNYDAAVVPIAEALELRHRFALGWMHYANVLGQLEKHAASRNAISQARDINPAMTPSHFEELMRKLSGTPAVLNRRTAGCHSPA